tara:strand:+ start:136 stop:345 length:210 start_codon:yes stop_codon:yes gene_type:complete
MTDKQFKQTVNDIKLSIHELGERIANLERNSHPPVFKEDTYDEIDARIQVIEAFYNNIKLITTDNKEIQ